jgi:hypothetical protein
LARLEFVQKHFLGLYLYLNILFYFLRGKKTLGRHFLQVYRTVVKAQKYRRKVKKFV